VTDVAVDSAHEPEDDDSIPISVRLGTVVPPEDPEDWTQPLTWVAALGMLAGPIVAILWFALAPPASGTELLPVTIAIAAAVVIGGVVTGATQIGPVRAFAGTLGAALFGALVVVIIGAAMAGERQVGSASPTLAHGFVGGVAGLSGALVAAAVAPAVAAVRSMPRRIVVPAVVGLAVAIVILRLLLAA
jgi:hypothetical protein